MIVTARAGHRETEKSARKNVYAVMPLIGPCFGRFNDLVIPGTERKQSQSWPQFPTIRIRFNQISSDLRFDELVIRHVPIECADHPVAIPERIRKRIFAESQLIRIRIARDIQPVPTPTFSIFGRSKQAIHNPGEGFRRRVFDETLHFFW